MVSLFNVLSASILLPLIQAVWAFDPSSSTNVVAYWGQNSAGSQGRLRSYCDDGTVDIFLLSFLSTFPAATLGLNFANACGNTFLSGMLNCDEIAEDITYCQSKGKKVMLSLGGEAGTYGFSSDAEAVTFAGTLWNTFGEGSAAERPFGTAVVDGFDLDIENKVQTGYTALVKSLRSTYFPQGSKKYYISAAPQCPYPDASVGEVMANAFIDFAFIQFYNNYCSLAGTSFNWNTWADYAANVSPNKDIKLYIGLAGSSGAAGSGYVDTSTVKRTIAGISNRSAFGGISVWDISQAKANADFAAEMKAIVVAAAPGEILPTTTSTTTPVWVAPTTSTTPAWVAPTTTTTPVWVAPTTSTTPPVWVAPTTSTAPPVWVAPTTSTTPSVWVAPTTTTTPPVWVAPTTLTSVTKGTLVSDIWEVPGKEITVSSLTTAPVPTPSTITSPTTATPTSINPAYSTGFNERGSKVVYHLNTAIQTLWVTVYVNK